MAHDQDNLNESVELIDRSFAAAPGSDFEESLSADAVRPAEAATLFLLPSGKTHERDI